MYGVLSLRSHRVPSIGAFYRFLPAWLRRMAAAALTLGTIGALGAILTVMAEDPGVRVPVIMYHAVMDDASRLGKYVISPEELESDFKWLSENGYTAILSEDLINYTENGAALPEKPILLTFDDGYYNNYLYAYPETSCQGLFNQIHRKATKKVPGSTFMLLTLRQVGHLRPLNSSSQRHAYSGNWSI